LRVLQFKQAPAFLPPPPPPRLFGSP
jgi:hypothetical protein